MPAIPLALLVKGLEQVGNEIGLTMYNGSLTTFVTSELQIDNVLENWETHGIIAIYHELSIENQVVITIEGTKKGGK